MDEIALKTQLTVGEMLTILNGLCPFEKIALHTDNDRYLYVIGLNDQLTQVNGTPTFDCIAAGKDKAQEEVTAALLRQKEAIEQALERAGYEEAAKPKKRGRPKGSGTKTKPTAKKPKKKTSAAKELTKKLAKGYIPREKGKDLKIKTEREIAWEVTTKQRGLTLKELDPSLNQNDNETTEIHQD